MAMTKKQASAIIAQHHPTIAGILRNIRKLWHQLGRELLAIYNSIDQMEGPFNEYIRRISKDSGYPVAVLRVAIRTFSLNLDSDDIDFLITKFPATKIMKMTPETIEELTTKTFFDIIDSKGVPQRVNIIYASKARLAPLVNVAGNICTIQEQKAKFNARTSWKVVSGYFDLDPISGAAIVKVPDLKAIVAIQNLDGLLKKAKINLGQQKKDKVAKKRKATKAARKTKASAKKKKTAVK